MGVIRELFARFGVQADTERLRQFEEGVDGAAQALHTARAGVLELARSIAGPLVAAMGVGALKGMTDQLAEQAFQVRRHAQALGISAEEMQVWGHAATMAGEDAQTMHDAMQTMGERARDAIVDGPTSDAAAMIKQLGIEIKDSNGQLVNNHELMLRVADALAGMTNQTDRAGLAQTLLGDDGARLAGVLLQGREGILAMGDEAKRLGVILDSEALQATNAYRQQTAELAMRLRSLGQIIVLEVMPRITALASKINAWWREGDRATRIVATLRAAIRIAAVAMAAFAAVKSVQYLMILVKWLRVAGLAYMRLGMRAAWAQVRVMLIPAAIVALILVIEDLYVWLTGGDSAIGSFIDRFKESDGVMGDVARALDQIKPKLKAAMDAAIAGVKALWPLLKRGLAAAWQMLKQAGAVLRPILDEMIGLVMDIVTELGPPLMELGQELWAAVLEIIEAIWPLIRDLVKTVLSIVKKAMPVVKMAIKGAITVVVGLIHVAIKVIRAVLPIATKVISWIIKGLTWLIPKIKDVIVWVIEASKAFWGGAKKVWAKVSPVLASGLKHIKEGIEAVAKGAAWLWLKVKGAGEKAVKWISPKWKRFKAAAGNVKDFIGRAVDAAISAAKRLKDKVVEALQPVVDFLVGWAQRLDRLAESLNLDLYDQEGIGGTDKTLTNLFAVTAAAGERASARAAGGRAVQAQINQGGVTINMGRPDERLPASEVERRVQRGVLRGGETSWEQTRRELMRGSQ